ncbi:MAG: hypothetical protein ABI947_22475 [Chloroflexota bacterium]
MADLQIGDELSATLHKMAASENLSVEALLSSFVERYQIKKNIEPFVESPGDDGWHGEALDNFISMFDDDVHDLSESVHESVTDAIRKKHAHPR